MDIRFYAQLCILIVIAILLCIIIYKQFIEEEFYEQCKGDSYNLERKIWGPSAWLFIHSIAFGYPENPTNQDKKNAKKFLESLAYIIPCLKCQKHYRQNIKKLPWNLDSREDFFRWTIDLHNEVNKSIGKPVQKYDDIYKLYSSMYEKFG